MSEPHSAHLANLRKMAQLGQWTVVIGGALVALYCAYLLSEPAEVLILMQKEIPGIQVIPSTGVLAAAATVAALPILAFMVTLCKVWQFFGFVKRNQHFSLQAQNCLRWLGRLAVVCAVTGVLARTIMGLLLTSANPPGQKMLIIGFSSGEVAAVVVGVLVFIFANIVREASALAKENASFV